MSKTTLREAAQKAALRQILQSDAQYVIGIDEVGYGCLAGPLVVCAAVCKKGWAHPDVKDSKKLSHEKRKKLTTTVLIPPAVVCTSIVSMTSGEVDKLGVHKARNVLSVRAATNMLSVHADSIVVMDGNSWPEIPGAKEVVMLPKADDLVPAVSAASIIAKENRDRRMKKYAEKYPGYGFENNVGYGTPFHMQTLQDLGPCPIHRHSYRPIAALSRRRRAAGRLRGWVPSKTETPGSTT